MLGTLVGRFGAAFSLLGPEDATLATIAGMASFFGGVYRCLFTSVLVAVTEDRLRNQLGFVSDNMRQRNRLHLFLIDTGQKGLRCDATVAAAIDRRGAQGQRGLRQGLDAESCAKQR